MTVLQPAPTTCPHCRLRCFTPTALDVHLRFQCIVLGRTEG